MKLLIFLAFITTVYSVNNITVLNNNKIYLSHTSNCVIYEISNHSTQKIVVGQSNFYGNIDNDDGIKALIKNPRNIIKNTKDTMLYFIDNDIQIKSVQIYSGIIYGTVVDTIIETNTSEHIFNASSYTYSSSECNIEYIYFTGPKNLYKVFISTTDNNAFETSNNTLDNNSNFINISYHSSALYYCYKSDDQFYFKKSSNSYNFNVESDTSLNINYTIEEITGFAFANDILVICGTRHDSNILESFTEHNDSTYTNKNTTDIKETLTALINYTAIYNDNNTDNPYIIGRRSDRKKFIKINAKTLTINSTSGSNVVNMSADNNITVRNANTTYKIVSNIVYNNKYLKNITENIILYYNNSSSNIQIIKYVIPMFKTTRLPLGNFSNIADIAIDKLNTLYIANKTNTSANIYTVDLDKKNYNKVLIYSNILPIKSLSYFEHDNTKTLHYITDQNYAVINLTTHTTEIFSNIVQTNDTDSLSKINDFIIDNNYEIGYIAFEKRLKWFYV
tara:strand:+ start:103 stop:1620 length:1518 start_codon:yes stop_codon:yes gene_type:complete